MSDSVVDARKKAWKGYYTEVYGHAIPYEIVIVTVPGMLGANILQASLDSALSLPPASVTETLK